MKYKYSECSGLTSITMPNSVTSIGNDRLSAEQAIITGVSPLGETEEGAVYDLQGRQIVNSKSSNSKLPKGINIIRYSDGTSRKVLVK